MAYRYDNDAGMPAGTPDSQLLSQCNALELDAIRTVVLREAHVARMSQLCFKYAAASSALKQAAKLPRHRRELLRVLESLRSEIQASVEMLRAASLAVAETIMSWQASATEAGLGVIPRNAYGVAVGPPAPPAFVWRGQNYVQKMCNDIAAITEATHTPLAAFTGVDPRSNPLLEIGPEAPPAEVAAIAEAAVRGRGGIVGSLHQHHDAGQQSRGGGGGGGGRRGSSGESTSSGGQIQQRRHGRHRQRAPGRAAQCEVGPPHGDTGAGGGDEGGAADLPLERKARIADDVRAASEAEAADEVRRANLAAGVRAELIAAALQQQQQGPGDDGGDLDARWAARAPPPGAAIVMPHQYQRGGTASSAAPLPPLQQRPPPGSTGLDTTPRIASAPALDRAPSSSRLVLAPLPAPAARPEPPAEVKSGSEGDRSLDDEDDAALLARLHRLRESLLSSASSSGALPLAGANVAQARRAHVLSLLGHPPADPQHQHHAASAAHRHGDADERLVDVDAAIAALEGNEQKWAQAVGRMQGSAGRSASPAAGRTSPPAAGRVSPLAGRTSPVPGRVSPAPGKSAAAAASEPAHVAEKGRRSPPPSAGGTSGQQQHSTAAHPPREQQGRDGGRGTEGQKRRASASDHGAQGEQPSPEAAAHAPHQQKQKRGAPAPYAAPPAVLHEAATSIEATIRGHLARKQVRARKASRGRQFGSVRATDKAVVAAEDIQRVARGHRARRRVDAMMRIKDLSAQCARLHAAIRPEGLVSLAALLSALDAGHQRAQAISSQLMQSPTSASAATAGTV
jgi:hypothetical protein